MLPFPIINQYGNTVIKQTITKISSGASHMAILYETGILYLTGLNNFGMLGTGDTTNYIKQYIIAFSNVKNVWCGLYGTLIRTNDNKMYYAGRGLAIGYGSPTYNYLSFTNINNFNTVYSDDSQIIPGPQGFLILNSNKDLYFIGYNSVGELGNNSSGTYHGTPVLVAHNVDEARLLDSSLIYRTGSTLYGSGNAVPFGTGSGDNIKTFQLITTSANHIGGNHLCNIALQNSTGYAAGKQNSSCLGIGNNISIVSTYTDIQFIQTPSFPFIEAYNHFNSNTNFIRCSDGVYGAGVANSLGVGSTSSLAQSRFAKVQFDVNNIKQLTTFYNALVILGKDNILYAAGNHYGLPGISTLQPTPVQIGTPL